MVGQKLLNSDQIGRVLARVAGVAVIALRIPDSLFQALKGKIRQRVCFSVVSNFVDRMVCRNQFALVWCVNSVVAG